MAVMKATLECKHTKNVPTGTDMWVGSLVRCSKCNTMKKIISIKA